MTNQGEIANAQQYAGSQNWDGLCEAFVEEVTGGQTGKYPSAVAAWQAQQSQGSTDFSKMQPGDVIYFSPNAGNNYAGHTGIYEGNGMMISASYNGVTESSVSQWMQSTGQQPLGFVPQKGDGQQALAGARQIGSELNGALASYMPQMQAATPQQTMRPPIQFGQQGQNPSNPFTNQPGNPMGKNIQMPPIQNNAASAPQPIQGMMTSMSPAGQNAGANQPGSGTPMMMPASTARLGPQNAAYSTPPPYGGYGQAQNIPAQGIQPQQVTNAQSIIQQAPTIPDITPTPDQTIPLSGVQPVNPIPTS